MSETLYDQICSHAAYLNLDLGLQELAKFVFDHQFDDGQIKAVSSLLEHLASNKRDNIVATLLKMSRLPLKEPKTFDNFDYSRLHGKNIEALKELSVLELNELVQACEAEFGVSAAAGVVVAAAAGPVEEVEEKTDGEGGETVRRRDVAPFVEHGDIAEFADSGREHVGARATDKGDENEMEEPGCL